jgi:opacity protein-like surface antigen
MQRALVLMVIGVVALAAPAAAQNPENKVNLNIGGGYTFTSGEVRNHLGDGYNFNIGVTFNATPKIGIQGEYSFNGLGEKQIDIPIASNPIVGAPTVDQPFFANMNMQYFDVNAVIKPSPDAKVSPYLIAGFGVYYRPIEVTTPGVGYVPGYCDPWWYVCYPGGWVPVENIIGERSSTDFGINVGGGIAFRVAEAASIYFEARYHYIWGPTVDASAAGGSSSQKANGQFFPITGGIRF